jgi:hypothetical protein
MINRNSKRKLFIGLIGILAVALLISVVAFSAKRQRLMAPQQPKPPTKQWLNQSSLPTVRSKVKDLEIINQRIVRADTELPGVAFEILNKSDRPVMAIQIICGKGGISQDGLEDEAHPNVIIEPHGTLTAEMNGELTPGFPIVLQAATFQDGKEEGDAVSLDFLQRLRTRERARHKAEREKQSTERRPNQ